MTMNEKINSWFNAGNIEEAINGDGMYFIPDVTFSDRHDLLLVIRQLFLWAFSGNLQKAIDGFTSCVERHLNNSELFMALDIYWSYRIIVESENKQLTRDEEGLRIKIANLVRDMASDLAHDEHLRDISLRFLDKFPDQKVRVGIDRIKKKRGGFPVGI